jgi:PAS domain S-box-containing protein
LNNQGRILIVDDNEESLKLLSGVLGSEGYDVRPADSGELALAAVTMSPPELILLDIRMPGMDGLAVCRELKSRPSTRHIPVIFLSASLAYEDRMGGLESGAVDFLNKPFRREELLARIRTHLELARLRKDLERRVAERTTDLQAANDQLKSELQMRTQAEAELRESEARFRSIADTTPAGILVFDSQGGLSYASQWFLSFLGCTWEQLLADGWQKNVHPDDLPFLSEEITAAIEEQRATQTEHRLMRNDGVYRWISATANPRFINGEFSGHIVILLDITELKRSQEEAIANQKLESLGVLSAGIAHDFNNLLSTILAHADLALCEIPSGSPANESVASIAQVAVRASEIVKLLMSYAGQADAGVLEWVDLSALIEEMIQLVQMSIPRTTSLRVSLANGLPPVWGNDSQIRQVLLNLILNASEALEARPGSVTVSASPMRVTRGSADSIPRSLTDGNYVLLEVSDTGCGISEDNKARIFDPFFSTKFLGRGLGLASVQGILRSSGGAIAVVSAPGQGSAFKVWLPCSGCAPERSPITLVQPNLTGTVLLVEDEEGLRRAVAGALKREGFSVLEASDGLAAVQLFAARSSEIDIVVLDMKLPGLSGSEVREKILRVAPDIPLIVCSAHSLPGRNELDGQPNQRFLQKPFRLRELIETLREMLAYSKT